LIKSAWGASAPLSVGVEEELMILDGESLEPVGAVDVFLRDSEGLDLPGRLKTEMHASIVELNTGICADAAEAVTALEELRATADAIARRHGLRVAAAGTHPIAVPEELPIVQEQRYLDMVAYVGPVARRQGVSGLHVHVGVDSADACFHALEGILQWLPLVLALSVNSPYLGGRETELLSTRAAILAELPRSGAPPAFRSYAEWEEWVERLVEIGVTADYTRIWWDVRPHPRFGTLEVRMPDQPTALERTGAFVELLRALVGAVLEEPQPPYDPARRGDYQQNRWAALRFGMDAELIHPDGSRALSARELAAELFERLGIAPFGEPEAARQLEVGRAGGLAAVCADLVKRTVA
jgi:glutamate---cysteine ligase / carboxylate-amine ligase